MPHLRCFTTSKYTYAFEPEFLPRKEAIFISKSRVLQCFSCETGSFFIIKSNNNAPLLATLRKHQKDTVPNMLVTHPVSFFFFFFQISTMRIIEMTIQLVSPPSRTGHRVE